MYRPKIVSVLLSFVMLFSLVIIPQEMKAASIEPLNAIPSSDVKLTFDLSASGQQIKNKFSLINMWDKNTYWTEMADNQPTDHFADKYPFVETIKLMTATGGCYVGFSRCTTNRDLFENPADRTVLDDYKFDSLIQSTRNIVNQGLQPYIVTGNVPIKYSTDPTLGVFELNVRPPSDYDVYYDYILAMANALVEEFGVQEVGSWRWGVITEFENADMFSTGKVNARETQTAYFKLYDYTVAALEDAIGAENVTIGAHSMGVSAGHWSHLEFIDHVAKGVNNKTGKIGTQLDFISASYYDQQPGIPNPYYKSLKDTLNTLRGRAIENGLMNLTIGIDEGRILTGFDGKELAPRAVGHTFQASADARLFRNLNDWNIDYFALWSLTTDGIWTGVDTISTHIANLSYRMVGNQQITPVVTGTPNDSDNEIDGIGGYDEADNKINLMVYNYNSDVFATTEESPIIEINNLAAVEGDTVTIKQWYIDDNNANFWPTWWADQEAQGIYANANQHWSQDSAEVMFTLTRQEDKNYWYSREETYKELAELKHTTSTATVSNGKLVLSPELDHHAVVFYEISNARHISSPNVMIDDLNDWSKVSTYSSDTLELSTANAALLEDPSRVMRKGSHYDAQQNEYIIYNYPGIVSIGLTALFASTSETIGDFIFYTSEDGTTWEKQYNWVTEDSLINLDLWTKREYTVPSVPANTNYFKLVFPKEEALFYNPQLSKIKLVYSGDCDCNGPLTYVDDLNDFASVNSHSNNLLFDTGNSELVNDTSRLIRSIISETEAEYVVYQYEGITNATVSALFSEYNEPIQDLKLYVSKDGSSWNEVLNATKIDTFIQAIPWISRDYIINGLASDINYLKIEFPLGGLNNWIPQLSRVVIETLPPIPTSLNATSLSTSEIKLAWSASIGADAYNIYRADSPGSTYVKINSLPVKTTNYKDAALEADTTYYYKVSAISNKGETVLSNAVSATTAGASLIIHTDELNDFSKAHAYSSGLTFDTQNGEYVDDNSRLVRKQTSNGIEWITYQYNDIKQAFINGLFSSSQEDIVDFTFYTSVDGENWVQLLNPSIIDTPVQWIPWTNRQYVLQNLPAGTNYLKIAFPEQGLYFWNPQLSRIVIHSLEQPVTPETPETPETPTSPTPAPPQNTATTPSQNPSSTIVTSNGGLQVQAVPDPNGILRISLQDNQIQQALDQSEQGIFSIQVNGQASSEIDSVNLSIPLQTLLHSSDIIHTLRINTGSVSIDIILDPIGGIINPNSTTLSMNVSLVDHSALPTEIQQKIGNNPVYDFSLSIDGNEVSQFQYPGAVTVNIKYDADEDNQPEQIVSYFINENGTLEVVNNSSYDPNTGMISFRPAHFSKYTVAHADVILHDLKLVPWAESVIRTLAAREIVNGKGDGGFYPHHPVTRAEYVQLIMKAVNLIDPHASSHFTDVHKKMWYYPAVASAESRNIIQGRGTGTFDAKALITREEMALIAYRVSLIVNAGETPVSNQHYRFSDYNQISQHALRAIEFTHQAGIINGYKDGTFRPKANATRAEAAAIVYRLMYS